MREKLLHTSHLKFVDNEEKLNLAELQQGQIYDSLQENSDGTIESHVHQIDELQQKVDVLETELKV